MNLQRRSARRRLLAWLVVGLAVIALSIPVGLAVLGRSGSGSSGSGSSSRPASAPAAPTGSVEAGAGGAASADAGSSKDAGSFDGAAPGELGVVGAAKLVRSAWLGITVADLQGAATRVRGIAASAGGRVTSENVVLTATPSATGTTRDPVTPPIGPNEARLVLGVPNAKLDGVLTELSQIGVVSHRSMQSDDVTDTYVDTRARVATMQAGVDRLRALVAQATNLQQVVTLEGELTRRQADLDALKARLSELDRRVAESEVTVVLTTSAGTPVADTGGLVGALRGAWDAFLTSSTVILTGLAAMLPWLVVILLVALGVRRLIRVPRRRPSSPD